MYHSTLGLRVIKKKENKERYLERDEESEEHRGVPLESRLAGLALRLEEVRRVRMHNLLTFCVRERDSVCVCVCVCACVCVCVP